LPLIILFCYLELFLDTSDFLTRWFLLFVLSVDLGSDARQMYFLSGANHMALCVFFLSVFAPKATKGLHVETPICPCSGFLYLGGWSG